MTTSRRMEMPNHSPAKQMSFRLPEELVERVEQCMKTLRHAGLDVTRADVVRMLLKHALDATHCRLDRLIRLQAPGGAPQGDTP